MKDPVIQISGLTKRYGRDRGIENINLQVEEGEIFGFIGPNGAGKSTTIRVLLNLLFPTSGRARIMGFDTVKDSKKIREQTGYIPSEANPYPYMSAREFLRYCASFYGVAQVEKRTGELMELFDAEPGRKISDLSSGNRKKLSIIQSFLHSPRLLIVNEPTTGHDPLMQSRFFDLVRSENRIGMTVFFSSHTLSDVQLLCRRVAIIREGQIVNVEEIETLRKKQLKKIHIEFSDSAGDGLEGLPGVESRAAVSEKVVDFIYSGNMNMLISALSGRNISDMTVEEQSLETCKKEPYCVDAFLILALYTLLLHLFLAAPGLFMSVLVKKPKPITTLSVALVMVLYFIFTISNITPDLSWAGYISPYRFIDFDVVNPAYRVNLINILYFTLVPFLLILSSLKIYLRKDIYL